VEPPPARPEPAPAPAAQLLELERGDRSTIKLVILALLAVVVGLLAANLFF
jgi:hypothetical protein